MPDHKSHNASKTRARSKVAEARPQSRQHPTSTNPELVIEGQWRTAWLQCNGYKPDGLAGFVFADQFDPKPLAAMLATGEPAPEYIASGLGVMLNPPAGWRGMRLEVKQPPKKRSQRALWQELIRKRAARAEYQKMRASGEKHIAALNDLMQTYRVKRTWLTDAIALDDDKFIALGLKGLSSRKR